MQKQLLTAATAIVLGFAFLVSSSNNALAYTASGETSGVVLTPALSYINHSQTDVNGNSSSDSTTYLDFGAYYLFTNGVYVGGKYVSDSVSYSGFSINDPASLNAYGPTVGYTYKGAFVDLTYFLGSTDTRSNVEKYSSGSGFGATIGYNLMFERFFIGPEFTYKNLSYTKANFGAGDISPKNAYKYSEIIPALEFGFVL